MWNKTAYQIQPQTTFIALFNKKRFSDKYLKNKHCNQESNHIATNRNRHLVSKDS
jgi:hypothetical protein